MEIKYYGTRGSIPISNRRSVEVGGNTTCVQVKSNCLPEGMILVVDAGSGFVPLGYDALRENVRNVQILFTHYHHDHTQGIPLAPLTFIKRIPISCWGPVDSGKGPREILEHLMQIPFFPVDFASVASHFTFHKVEHPNTKVIIVHPEGGIKQLPVDQFENFESSAKLLPIRDGKYHKSECLIIKLLRSNHPERTISYRFEEGPTGKAFVLLTDHENQDGIPNDLKAHLKGADLLTMDSQYKRDKYMNQTAGFGHGTADYCAKVALTVGAKRLGLTHHDPSSTDEDVEQILLEAQKALEVEIDMLKKKNPQFLPSLTPEQIMICRDYQTFTL